MVAAFDKQYHVTKPFIFRYVFYVLTSNYVCHYVCSRYALLMYLAYVWRIFIELCVLDCVERTGRSCSIEFLNALEQPRPV